MTLSENSDIQDLIESLLGSWKIRTEDDEIYVFDEDQASAGALRN